MILIIASLTSASAVLARCSRSRARRRLRLIQASVRSTVRHVAPMVRATLTNALGQHRETLGTLFPVHDLEAPFAGARDGVGGIRALIALIGEDDR